MNIVTIDTYPGNVSMYIAPNNTSYLQLGANASSIVMGNANCSTFVNGPLVMGTGKSITLQPTASYVAPTAMTMLGGISSSAISGISLTGTGQTVATLTSLGVGTYVITATVVLQFTSSAVNQVQMNIRYGANDIANNVMIPLGAYTTAGTSNTMYMNCCGIHNNTVAQDITLVMSASYALGTNVATTGGVGLKAIRIG